MPKPTHWTRCTVELPNGAFCDTSSMQGVPFPICGHHARQLFEFVRDELLSDTRQVLLDVAESDNIYERMRARSARELKKPRTCVVYYVRVNDRIKIGTSIDVKKRMEHYPPGSELLATERGSFVEEQIGRAHV